MVRHDRQRVVRRSCHGTLVENTRDAAQTLYRRNRYYDPATGRFTQPDPIGLAGGMNVHGFAGDDPVNHSGAEPMRAEFTIEVASVPHREELVAELWLGAEQVAELSQDGGILAVQLYPAPNGHWEFDFESFQAAIAAMKTRLLPSG